MMMMMMMGKKPLSWTLRKQCTLLSLLLLLLTAVLVTSKIILPKIELQRVHLEYDIPQKNDYHHYDRSVQEQSIPYEPIRIAFDTRVLDSLYGLGDTEVDAKIDFIKSTILPQTAQRWSQHLYVTPVMSWITPIVIGPESCGGGYANFLTSTIPYTDADLVIVVGGDPDNYCSGGTLAYAIPCSLDSTLNRPVTGTFNFCLAKVSSTSLQIGDGTSALQRLTGSNIPSYYSAYANTTFYPERLSISILDVTVHEVAHVLGFSDLLYPITRDEYGVPRTPRNASNFNQPLQIQRTCGNGSVAYGYFPSENVVQVIQPSAEDPNRYEQYFVTERVRTISQIHFNCSTLIGARLEDVEIGGPQCFGAHWHERQYYGELLSPTVSEGSENILSLLTLAYMEDTGWYKVDCT
jgi:Leishmanolysin